MQNFSVNDFLVILEAEDNPVKWNKRSSNSIWYYTFKIEDSKGKVTARIETYEENGWLIVVECTESLVDISDSFFATLGSIIQDFVKVETPTAAQIVFFGEQNLNLEQIALLKRKIKEVKYDVRINRVPNAFSISIVKR